MNFYGNDQKWDGNEIFTRFEGGCDDGIGSISNPFSFLVLFL